MKTERRHELQTNDLADWLGKRIEHYKPELKLAGGAVIALLVVSAVYVWFQQHKSAQSGETWGEFMQASLEQNPDEQATKFQKIATSKDNVGADTALWAMLSEGDLDLSRGSELLFSDRELAVVELERAKKNFSQVEQDAVRNPLLLMRARFGLAQTLECLGDLAKAKEKYELIHKSSPEGELGKAADKRAKRLDDKSIGEFYAWFEKQKPRPRTRPGVGGLPFQMDDLPDRPDLNLPGGGQFVPSPSTKPSDDSDAPDKSEPKSDGEKPDADKPEAKTDKPAPEPDKPASEKDKPSPASENKTPAPATEQPK